MTDTCPTCEWAEEVGSWVDAPGQEHLTHCRVCHGSWGRRTEWQHCTSCHRTFSTVVNADLHRRSGRCEDPADIVAKKTGKRLLFPGLTTSATMPVWQGPPKGQESLNRLHQSHFMPGKVSPSHD